MIISIRGEPISEGQFVGNYEVIGASREECLTELAHKVLYADDLGDFTRVEKWTDQDGVEQELTKTLYRMIGGTISV